MRLQNTPAVMGSTPDVEGATPPPPVVNNLEVRRREERKQILIVGAPQQ